MATKIETGALRGDLVSIVQDVFQTMLAMEATPDDQPIGESGTPVVTACMHMSGPWKGAVLLQCHLPAACEFTATLQGIGKPSGADDDVKDAMGELINMVAGNFKAVLGGGIHLSLPVVVEGSDYRFRILGGEETTRVGFQTDAGPVYVSLIEISRPAERR